MTHSGLLASIPTAVLLAAIRSAVAATLSMVSVAHRAGSAAASTSTTSSRRLPVAKAAPLAAADEVDGQTRSNKRSWLEKTLKCSLA